ncbi:hypothetical protein UlMin_037809 [Ulmus minor]
MSSLYMLDLSDNRLTGNIPQNLGNLKFLKILKLDSNNFTGELPPNFSELKNLEYFSIAGNNLAGPFPDFITKWPNIRSLNLVGNNFSGNIPAEIFNRTAQLINGSIPENIGFIPSLYKLDLSFNELTGNIPSSLGNVSSRYLNSYISLAENKLNGAIPDWIPAATKNSIGMDLSFNDFSNSSFNFGSSYTKLNLFSCCRSCNSSTCESQIKNVCQSQPKSTFFNLPFINIKKTLHINCGGEETDINGIIYENDTDSSPFYKSPHGNWARISSGEQSIVEKVKCGIFVTDAPLYDEARVSTVSLKYYGLCLEDGEYNVTLHFAEIKFANNTDEAENTDNDSSDQGDQSSKKRIFNINIQNQWVRTDFNIKETAGEAKKETKVEVPTVQVNNSRLEIHLYWAGKGSYSLNNGPLISAISVVPSDIKRGKLSRLHVALISVASVVVFVLLLVFIIAWAMGWLRKEEMHEIRVGPEKIVTLKQLMDATRRFSKEMEIGRGGLGIVYKVVDFVFSINFLSKLCLLLIHTYLIIWVAFLFYFLYIQNTIIILVIACIWIKAELPDKQMVAVKRLSTLSSEGIDKLRSEFYTMETLRHENLVQLFDLFFGKDLFLLIYEYMENKSLADALFDSKYKIRLSWEARFNICLGIAKGLQYLHEHPRLKMVHRGIKAVNILLDSDLKPKISDFGLASVYAEDDQGAGQLKIIKSEASHGYMAPEYPLYGMITTKYDVYGFGVVILEIVSGKKNAGHKFNQELEFLVDEIRYYRIYAQVCLADSKGRLLDLVDKSLGNSYDQKEAIILLKLAVKCTNISPILRPSMAQLLSVLIREKTLDEIYMEIANTGSATTKNEDSVETSTSSHV